jgi:hypothetical protein
MVKTQQFTTKFFREIGAKGGRVKTRKGFGWMDRARLREISREANRKRWGAVRAAKEAE